MKRNIAYILFFSSAVLISCGGKTEKNGGSSDSSGVKEKVNGDSTLYGLACEGCTDSVLVFLSFDGGDPMTYDIIEASQEKRIIGKPETGDWVGVVLSHADKKKADMVIDLDQLKGTWVYMAMPQLRKEPHKDGNFYVDRQREDSMLKTLMVPREQGFTLKRNNVAEPAGTVFNGGADKKNPVIYPEVKLYTDWSIFNGKLVLRGKAPAADQAQKNTTSKAVSDTAEFVFMRKDSLRLRFKDEVKGYYRKR